MTAAAVVSHVSLAPSCLGLSANGGPDLIYHRLGEIPPGSLPRQDAWLIRQLPDSCATYPPAAFTRRVPSKHIQALRQSWNVLQPYTHFGSPVTKPAVCRLRGLAVRQAGGQAPASQIWWL